jgi:hypothetical protein
MEEGMLKRIISEEIKDNYFLEWLECGHKRVSPITEKRAKRRKCNLCKALQRRKG